MSYVRVTNADVEAQGHECGALWIWCTCNGKLVESLARRHGDAWTLDCCGREPDAFQVAAGACACDELDEEMREERRENEA